ncbi:ABC transporter permease [Tessaracoccus sp. MC1865]|uniref:ABC transporter permease n=1 Tax=unclassified Tessaracoccus TaxID=2635419 RepID=UPI001600F82D|nr:MULTISPECIES: ABC transporter permease [unclassified Tessaracoccus]MBB1483648.1 ABC transporter permease [Tessaracoccus sp. MC1865]MBB1508842.1 ABC transporter permease [Tessaracoccus sp. MC1756]QTO36724.1 ABC transporter permease [Tessaracoccus sp. MC1865]
MTDTPRTRTSPWIIVAKREILVQLTDRAFWIGTLTTIALIALGFIFGGLLGGDSSETKVAVSSDAAATVVAMAQEEGSGNYTALRVPEADVMATVEEGDASAALTHSEADGWQLTVKDLFEAPDLRAAVADYQMGVNAAEHNLDLAAISAGTELELVTMEDEEGQGMAVIISTIAFALLFMMSAMTFGMQIANSVVTEKESRIVEILAAAIPTRQLLLGKVVGSTIMALAQVVLIAATALVGLSLSEWSSMVGLVTPVVGWFVLFFLVGFASLACLWAAAGAMATRHQDLNQTTTPLMTIVMLVYMAGFLARGDVAHVLSYVPIASTVSMPGRLLSGESTWLDAGLAMVVAVAFMALCIWLGSKIYRRALMQTGSVLSWKDALRRQAA